MPERQCYALGTSNFSAIGFGQEMVFIHYRPPLLWLARVLSTAHQSHRPTTGGGKSCRLSSFQRWQTQLAENVSIMS